VLLLRNKNILKTLFCHCETCTQGEAILNFNDKFKIKNSKTISNFQGKILKQNNPFYN